MRNIKSLIGLLLFYNLSIHPNYPKIIFYRTPLSRELLENGISSFIRTSTQQSETEYKDALNDIIDNASLNKIDVPQTLNTIHDMLNDKIQAINTIPKETTTDYKQIAIGVGAIGAGLAINYGIYCLYQNKSSANENEYNTTKKSLENDGIKVNDTYNIRLTLPFGHPKSPSGRGQKLADLANNRNNIQDLSLMGVTVSLVPIMYGVNTIKKGLDPHHDDINLEKYKNMLTIVKDLQQKNSQTNKKNASRNLNLI